jgi:hypothetical protein
MLYNNDDEKLKKLITFNLISEAFKCLKSNSGALAYEQFV